VLRYFFGFLFAGGGNNNDDVSVLQGFSAPLNATGSLLKNFADDNKLALYWMFRNVF